MGPTRWQTGGAQTFARMGFRFPVQLREMEQFSLYATSERAPVPLAPDCVPSSVVLLSFELGVTAGKGGQAAPDISSGVV
jgi:hypothetical protein